MSLESFVKKTFATMALITGIGLATAFGQDRSANDYLVTGYGKDLVWTESGAPIENANIQYEMTYTTGDSIAEIVNEQTSELGSINWNLWVHWELYVGQQENKVNKVLTNVFPNPSISPTVNIEAGEEPREMKIFNGAGELTDIVNEPNEYKNGIAGYHVNCLTDNANGTYFFQVNTSEGLAFGKILKIGNHQTPYLGIKTIPEAETEDKGQKRSEETPYAIYEKTITASGYDTLIVEETIYEDENDTKIYTLFEEGSNIPQYQWITGYTYGLTGSKLSEVIVEMYNRANDQFIESVTTNSSGLIEFEYPVPAGTDIYFKAQKNEDYRCFDASTSTNVGDTYEVPDIIEFESDTTNPNLRIALVPVELNLPDGGTVSPASIQIRGMFPSDLNVEGALRNVKYWLDPGLGQSRIQAYRTNATNFGNIMGHPGLLVESDSELNQDLDDYDPYTNPKPVGINVRSGSNNTDPDNVYVTTSLGNILKPVFSAETTISGTEDNAHYHEIYLALGGKITSGNGGISEDTGETPTNNDKGIINMVVTYSKLVYDDQKSSFTLRALHDEIQTQTFFPAKDVPLPSEKYERTKTSNSYEFSSSENYNYINQ